MSPEQIARERKAPHAAPARRTPRTVSTVAVIGLGYVGLPLAITAAGCGYDVIGFDIDEVKTAQLERREANFLNDDESEAFQSARTLSITSHERDLDGVDAFIICVPTPVHDNHAPDLGPLESACEIVGRHLSAGALVVVESTVNPNACEGIALPILERASKLSRFEFRFAHCPERINPGDPRWNVRTIPRVLGAIDAESLAQALSLYRSLIDADILPMQSIKEAEAVKMVENSFRDVNIAFVNELAMSFDKAGIDIVNVINGASTKPFGFMAHYPGCGVGGHCIPVDPYYLIRFGRDNGFEHRFLMTARRINSSMPHYAVKLLTNALRNDNRTLKKSTVALLGLAYKRDVPDMRESPALEIRDLLVKRGATVRIFDPYVLAHSSVRTLEDALRGASAVVIATDHAQFRRLTPRQFEEMGVSIVIDGRNCLDKEAFGGTAVAYHGIGRS